MSVNVRDLSRRVKRLFRWKDPDRFLQRISGVVHVGANVGQERFRYAEHDLDVIWVEPIPEVFATLQQNIRDFPRQHAYNCLITDKDGERYDFHVASNEGASSSILDMHLHKEVWPSVAYDRTIELSSVTLNRFFEQHQIDADKYDALILDTQGSELLVLRGASHLIPRFRYVKTEVPDFEAYVGCCLLDELDRFLGEHGFALFSQHEFAARARGGSYYDVVYRQTS